MLISKSKLLIDGARSDSIQLKIAEISADMESVKIINSSTNMIKIMNQSLLDSQAIADGNLRLQYRMMNPQESIRQLIEYFKI